MKKLHFSFLLIVAMLLSAGLFGPPVLSAGINDHIKNSEVIVMQDMHGVNALMDLDLQQTIVFENLPSFKIAYATGEVSDRTSIFVEENYYNVYLWQQIPFYWQKNLNQTNYHLSNIILNNISGPFNYNFNVVCLLPISYYRHFTEKNS